MHSQFRGILALVVGVVLALGGPVWAQGKRVALVIGNSAYEAVPHLPNPSNDARAIANLLIDLGFETRVRMDMDAEGMRNALAEFEAAVKGSQIAAIYYAGHGIEMGGENFLIPVDAVLARDADVEAETIALERLLQSTSGAGQLQLVMIDACRNNPFLLDIERTLGDRTVGKGLARIEPVGSTLVSFAAGAGMTAFDGSGVHSPYTEALLDHLDSPGLEVNYIFRRVNAAVRTFTADAQQPVYYGTLDDDEIYLIDPPQGAVTQSDEDLVRVAYEHALSIDSADGYQAFVREFPGRYYSTLAEERITALEMAAQARALESAPLEDVYWITIRGSAVPEDFEAYLRRFPDGIYADLAEARISALRRSEEVIGLLADGQPGTDELTLRRAAAAQLDRIPFNMVQYGLVALGFNINDVNGILDTQTRGSIRSYQASVEAPQTGRLTDQQTIDLLLAAAAVGDAYAQMTVGVMLADGIFWQKNYNFARMWLARSANQDNPHAMTNLAILYRDGLGTAPDEEQARILLKRAIVLGSDDAQEVLRALELS